MEYIPNEPESGTWKTVYQKKEENRKQKFLMQGPEFVCRFSVTSMLDHKVLSQVRLDGMLVALLGAEEPIQQKDRLMTYKVKFSYYS